MIKVMHIILCTEVVRIKLFLNLHQVVCVQVKKMKIWSSHFGHYINWKMKFYLHNIMHGHGMVPFLIHVYRSHILCTWLQVSNFTETCVFITIWATLITYRDYSTVHCQRRTDGLSQCHYWQCVSLITHWVLLTAIWRLRFSLKKEFVLKGR